MSKLTVCSLLVAALFSALQVGHAENAVEQPGADDQSIILVKFSFEAPPEIGPRRPWLVLSQYGSKFSLRVPMGTSLQHFTVPAGRYYLRRAETGVDNLVVTDNPEPNDISKTILVPPHTVVYVGDFLFDKTFVFHVDFTRDSLLAAKNIDIPRWPLKVSKIGAPLLSLSWD